ncbi:sentrin/sumo-specific protease, putative [Entamoeba invadens IP1]|uniref:Sentrin/sumo-specific protease, putative n=1 Tax=Entamoeba invadens IP1 TaxID=370355 RepID=A0A0A1UGC6_ENTIV|nr:sentrin/sumo-specific protease, putative [Entamoeba invadens IP1]ELP94768.1 sentrin/sumo-specific protease, putative [Entamoeba invadens IP1]|eukprot:XP_004261539.1 sentrin/sumo-specific protease, putative [Entamoeba invadens IP1]
MKRPYMGMYADSIQDLASREQFITSNKVVVTSILSYFQKKLFEREIQIVLNDNYLQFEKEEVLFSKIERFVVEEFHVSRELVKVFQFHFFSSEDICFFTFDKCASEQLVNFFREHRVKKTMRQKTDVIPEELQSALITMNSKIKDKTKSGTFVSLFSQASSMQTVPRCDEMKGNQQREIENDGTKSVLGTTPQLNALLEIESGKTTQQIKPQNLENIEKKNSLTNKALEVRVPEPVLTLVQDRNSNTTINISTPKRSDVIDVDDTQHIVTKKRPAHNTRLQTKIAKMEEELSVEMFCYKGVPITVNDFQRVKDEMLNDAVVNFYIEFLKDQIRDDSIEIWNTYFFEKLEQEQNQAGLDKWVKTDWKTKRFVILPKHINNGQESGHWNLYVVCCSGLVEGGSDEFQESPCILTLDSISNVLCGDSTQLLRKFVKRRFAVDQPKVSIKTRKVKVPQQKNGIDCGVFMLYFLDTIARKKPSSIKQCDALFSFEKAIGFRKVIEDAMITVQSLLLD